MGPEKTFETKVKKYLDSKGVWYVKFFANGFTKKGVPDLLACVNGHFLAIEVKSETGKPSPLQLRNIEKIQECGGTAIILYPEYFDSFKKMVSSLLESERRGHAIASGVP